MDNNMYKVVMKHEVALDILQNKLVKKEVRTKLFGIVALTAILYQGLTILELKKQVEKLDRLEIN